MIEDHQPITIRNPMGLYDRGDDDIVPVDHLISCWNCEFENDGSVYTRQGAELGLTVAGLTILRFHMYKRVGEVDRYLFLDNAGRIYDSANSLVTPILTVAGMIDFSMTVIFNRAYISPHNGVKGLPGQFVYVYEGSGVARKAAGIAPTGFALAAAKGAAGHVEKGKRLIAIAYETASGHISKYGPEPYILYEDTVGGFKINLTNIQAGGAEIIYKHVLMSQALPSTYNGDPKTVSFYYVPNGNVLNAVTDFIIDVYDTELIDSADDLADQLTEIPAGLGLCAYSGRMVVWGADINDAVIRVSEVDRPEAFNDIDGFLVVRPGSGGGVKNCVPDPNEALYIHKDQRGYVTRDNGSEPTTWKVLDIESSKGTRSVYGTSKILDSDGQMSNGYLLASMDGLYHFDGKFLEVPLTYDINKQWERINSLYHHKIQVVLDPILKKIYVSVPLDASTVPDHLFVGDYQLGMAWERIRWSVWKFPVNVVSIACDVKYDTKKTIFRFTGGTNLYNTLKTALNDWANAIDSYTETALLGDSDSGVIHHFGGLNARIVGSGSLEIQVSGLDATNTVMPLGIVLEAAPGREIFRGFNFSNERCSIKLRVSLINHWFYWNKLTVFASPVWATRPQ